MAAPAPVQRGIMLKLKSKDGEVFEVEKAVALQIGFVSGMLEGELRLLRLLRPRFRTCVHVTDLVYA